MSKLAAKKMKLEDKEFNEKQVFEHCFNLIKPSLMSEEEYLKFRIYRKRYNDGTLGKKGREAILNRFGFVRTDAVYMRIEDAPKDKK